MSGTSGMPPTYLENGSTALANRVYDNVQVMLSGVQLPAVQMELWNVVQDFCKKSSYFRVEVQFTFQPGQTEIDFNPFSSDMQVYQILRVKYMPYYTVIPPAKLINQNVAYTTTPLVGWAMLALMPTSFGELPGILFDLYFEAMLSGTISRLAAHPNKPYTSVQLVTYHGGIYRTEIRRARDQAERFNSGQQPVWNFPYFARGRRKN